MFKDCDTIWCCWFKLSQLLWHSVWVVRWPIIAYALLYAGGAMVFLGALRIRSEDGTLTVDERSWCYAIAHPLRYGGHTESFTERSSICIFYAQMFNMLVFIWPIILTWWIVCSAIGLVVTFLVEGSIVYPDLTQVGFVGRKNLIKDSNGDPFDAWKISVPAIFISLIIFRLSWLVLIVLKVGWVLLCLLPIIIIIGGSAWSSRKIYRAKYGEETTASAIKEYLRSGKEKFCKIVVFKRAKDVSPE